MHHIYTKKKFLLFSLPMFLAFTLLFILPLFLAFGYSFTSYRGVGQAVWNNFKNYKLLFTDKLLGVSIANTLKMAAINLILTLPVSFSLAYLLRETSRKNTIYKTVLFAPYVIPGAIAGLIWLFMLDPVSGLVNSVLRSTGLDALALQWIGGKSLSPYSIGMVCVWSGLGFYMVLWQLGIKNLPGEVLEASLIDGCSKRQQITKVMLPMLRGTISSIVIFILTGALKIYEYVYILTGGGPNHYSESIVSYMYTTTFQDKQYGYGMAIAVVEFTFALMVTALSMFISNRKRVEL